MIEIRRNDIESECAVCGRTMLLGERLVSYHRPEAEDAQVCMLCVDEADARGWLREGTPAVPMQTWSARPRGLRGFLGTRKRPATEQPLPYEPAALPETPREAVAASIELFNESSHRRTVSGITRTLGEPRVSVIQRSHREVVVTVAWDLSWYQFRVDMLGAQPVTLQHRGEEVEEIDSRFQHWNAHAEADGTLALTA
jgi:hypothetical protein